MFGRSRKDRRGIENAHADDQSAEEVITDVLASDPAQLQREAGPLGRAFINAVDTAVHLQTETIRAYVHWLRRQNPEAAPHEIQELMSKHFRNTAAGTGAGVGATAAVPGIGLVTGTAAIAGESVLFLDLAAFYTVASAYLRGEDIADPERRRAMVLTTLMGSKGVAVVDALLGEDAQAIPNKTMLSRFSGPGLAEANNILTRVAMRSMNKRLRRAWFGKLLPLGLGAAAGTAANRKMADVIITNVQGSLGAVPSQFAEPLPARDSSESGLSSNPARFAAWIWGVFGRGNGRKHKRDVPEPEERGANGGGEPSTVRAVAAADSGAKH